MQVIFPPTFRGLRRGLGLVGFGVTVLVGFSARAAAGWTDISSGLLTRLTNNGAKAG